MRMKYVHLGLMHLAKGVLAFILYMILGLVFVSMSLLFSKIIIFLMMFLTIVISLIELTSFVGDMIKAYAQK